MDATNETAGAVERLRAAAAAFEAQRPAIDGGRPWPLHTVEEGGGPESEWGPTEVLAHVAEMLQFWLGEIERVLDDAPEPVPFGRTVADRVRVLTIERDRTLPPRELVDRIKATVERYARRLDGLGAAELARRGRHPTVGEINVNGILERFVVGHAEGHVAQLAESLGAPTHSPD
jgi:DinB family protein